MDLRPGGIHVLRAASPVLKFSAERDTDLLLADFTFYGFTVDKSSNPTSLVATATQTPDNWIGVVVQLPPQAIGEADYDSPQKSPLPPFDPTPVLSQVSGPSRLAFTFSPDDRIPLPTMTVADLIDWSRWELHVPSAAVTGTGASPTEPGTIQTAIECPLALFLAPVVEGQTTLPGALSTHGILHSSFTTQFENRTEPFVSSGKVTECWATSLSGKRTIVTQFNTVTSAIVPSVAVVWASDYAPPDSADPTPDATPESNIDYSFYQPTQ
jgi:hypothetical protein